MEPAQTIVLLALTVCTVVGALAIAGLLDRRKSSRSSLNF